ncbi:MAG: leucine--tRNA ligase [Parcubacteria group bacterium]|jgi:leucyl-tRNA synthetase
MKKYNHKKIEKKWQKYWEDNLELSQAQENSDKPKFYCLDMFPYPSGAGLHVGHVENYTATDIYSRFKRMNDFNVLHPIGWDAFGLPAENFAIKQGVHPDKSTHDNIKNFINQIKSIGISYDWSREIDTSSPEYYKWTQWFFLFLYKNGLAYKKKAKANWCESCKTVVANEQVVDGKCERCGGEIIQKDLEQWFFKITDFIEDFKGENGKEFSGLINGLDKIDWPNSTKISQKNWIGKSEGTIVSFEIKISNEKSATSLNVFTTRVDTIFGCTYVVLAPESSVTSNLKSVISNQKEVDEYIEATKKKTDLERMENKEKTGVEVKGVKAINPFNNEEVPIYIADYVIGSYGTGAVMAVPAHDERDFEFANNHNLLKKGVIIPSPIKSGLLIGDEIDNVNDSYKHFDDYANKKKDNIRKGIEIFVEDGTVIDSGEYSGLKSEEAREKMTAWLEKEGKGEMKVNYRLRDWLVSRQRYWGAPIPIIYCDKCGEVAVLEKDLPVMLPTDVDFKPTGESPLAISKSFHDVTCPLCGEKARRESDTMDTFVCSSWYYLRFADSQNKEEFASRENLEKWLPVDLYMGGAEHTVLHLLYARFFTKVLAKYGYINFDEPFLKLRHQGMIMAEDGRKMSKSLGNVVNPDDVVEGFGADALRIYEMFMGPIDEMKAWSMQNVNGPKNFLDKVWKIFNEKELIDCGGDCKDIPRELPVMLHKTIKKVTIDIESFNFNTAISQMMIFINEFGKHDKLPKFAMEKFLILLAPFAPHMAEEIWSSFAEATADKSDVEKYKQSIFLQKWPEFDEAMTKDEEVEMVVQVNGKIRDRIKINTEISEEEAKKIALESEKVKVYTEGKEIRKVIYVKGKLISIVVG